METISPPQESVPPVSSDSSTVHVPDNIWTTRLRLRPLLVSDAVLLFKDCSDLEVTRYLAWNTHQDISETTAFLDDLQTQHVEQIAFYWCVELQNTGELVGLVTCSIQGENAAIGYLFSRAHWGKGYGIEAVSGLLDWVETLDGLNGISATCDTENFASMRLLEKLGFMRSGIARNAVVFPNIAAEPRDIYWYWLKLKPDSDTISENA